MMAPSVTLRSRPKERCKLSTMPSHLPVLAVTHRVLEVTIWLADIQRDYKSMNQVYDVWVKGHAPTRACIEARLARPDLLVEIRVVAATGVCSRPKRLVALGKTCKNVVGAAFTPVKWAGKMLAPLFGIRLPGRRRHPA